MLMCSAIRLLHTKDSLGIQKSTFDETVCNFAI